MFQTTNQISMIVYVTCIHMENISLSFVLDQAHVFPAANIRVTCAYDVPSF